MREAEEGISNGAKGVSWKIGATKKEGIAAPGGILLVRLANVQIHPHYRAVSMKRQGNKSL